MIRYVMVTAIISFLLASCGDDVGSGNAGELGVARYNEDIDPDDYLPSCLDEKQVDVVYPTKPFTLDLSVDSLDYTYVRTEMECNTCDIIEHAIMEWRACESSECSELRRIIPGSVIEERPYEFGIRMSEDVGKIKVSLLDEAGEVMSSEVQGKGAKVVRFEKDRQPGMGPYTLTASGGDGGEITVSAIATTMVRYIKSECL